jgi:phosphoribosylformimino-5-aminoimidazole carboxamide ribotide isomerase
MRVIPVLDLRRGQAVRAVAGERDHYGPLRSLLHGGTDPVELARAARDAWGLPDLYLADLDALLGESSPKIELFQRLRDLGLTLWIDAGVREPADVRPLIEAGVERVIVGLETIQGPEALAEIVAEVGAERVVFSLDLHHRRPLMNTSASWGTDDTREIAARVIDIGIWRIIHLDLARVGTGHSPYTQGLGQSLYWLADLALANPGVEWLVGGGIDSPRDLEVLAGLGAWGVLVGSALHDGRMTAVDLKSVQSRWKDCP